MSQARRIAIDYDTVHVPARDQRQALLDELAWRGSRVVAEQQDLIFTRDVPGPAAWAQNSWLCPREYQIQSIGEGARVLSTMQRNWHLHTLTCHRRARLMADKLAPIRFRPIDFPSRVPTAPLGAFGLLDRNRLLASPRCTSAFADGMPVFNEDRQGPPNRAYLKLWEALVLAGQWPQTGEGCLDLGACPGGWSWVLRQLDAHVTAVDRAVLASALMADKRLEFRRGDAFNTRLEHLAGRPQWIFSDVIAYPERLLSLARYWCQACPEASVIMTIKFQGRVTMDIMSALLHIPNGRLMHLFANKHELTFFRLPEAGPEAALSRDVLGI